MLWLQSIYQLFSGNSSFNNIPEALVSGDMTPRVQVPTEALFLFPGLRSIKICLLSAAVQFSSVAQSCPTLFDPMDCSMTGLPVNHQLPEFTQTHVHWIGDAIQPSHPLSSPFSPAFNHSQHQGLFKRVSSSHHVVKVLKTQLHHWFFQWIFRTDFL